MQKESIAQLIKTYKNHYCLLNHTVVQVTGQDATSFLQGQLTININTMTQKSSTLGCHLNPKGRIISLFHCFKESEHHYYLIINQDQKEITLKGLKKYALFSKVTIEEISKKVYGLIDCHFEIAAESFIFSAWNDHEKLKLMLSTDTHLFEKNPPCNPEVWHALSILHYTPYINLTNTETMIPIWLNLDTLGAIDFKKGCYTGQEIIARMHFRNKRGKEPVIIDKASNSSIDSAEIDGKIFSLEVQ